MLRNTENKQKKKESLLLDCQRHTNACQKSASRTEGKSDGERARERCFQKLWLEIMENSQTERHLMERWQLCVGECRCSNANKPAKTPPHRPTFPLQAKQFNGALAVTSSVECSHSNFFSQHIVLRFTALLFLVVGSFLFFYWRTPSLLVHQHPGSSLPDRIREVKDIKHLIYLSLVNGRKHCGVQETPPKTLLPLPQPSPDELFL